MSSNTTYGYCGCGCGQKTKIAKQTNSKCGYVKGVPRQYIHGHRVRVQPSLDSRFWSKVAVSNNPDECWEWQKGKSHDGYGYISIGGRKGKRTYAHRIAWEFKNGTIPSGLFVLHSCDNPACCNPKHLFLGTRQDNSKDKVNKGRQAKGENNGAHKLNEGDVLYIRERYSRGDIRITDLANELGLGRTHVRDIVHRKTWKHI
jgi:hypothetical protein